MAIGGYTTAALVVHEHWRDVWTIPLAGLAAGVVGFLIGLPGPAALRPLPRSRHLRVRGRDAVAAAEILRPHGRRPGPAPARVVAGAGDRDQRHGHDLRALDDAEPLPLLPDLGDRPRRLPDHVADRARPARAACSAAVRDSEIAAASAGVNLARYKTLAFAISGVYAGVAGSLLAIQDEIVNPLTFTFLLSILILVGAVVGGLGLLPGMVLGALLRPVPAGPLDARLEQARRARLRLRRGHHPRHDPAPERRRRAAPPARRAANNPVVHSSLTGMRSRVHVILGVVRRPRARRRRVGSVHAGSHLDRGRDRRDDAADGLGVRLSVGRARGRRVLQVRQLARAA